MSHISGDLWELVQITIHVWPSSMLFLVLLQIMVSLSCVHISIFILEIDFVIELVLGVGKVLHGPGVLFGGIVSSGVLSIGDLLFSLALYHVDLIGSQSLEMVWHISMWSQLRGSSLSGLSHELTHVGSGDLKLVLVLLVVVPVFLVVSLLIGQSLLECL